MPRSGLPTSVHDHRIGCSTSRIRCSTSPDSVFNFPDPAFTFPRIRCSTSAGFGVHDPADYADRQQPPLLGRRGQPGCTGSLLAGRPAADCHSADRQAPGGCQAAGQGQGRAMTGVPALGGRPPRTDPTGVGGPGPTTWATAPCSSASCRHRRTGGSRRRSTRCLSPAPSSAARPLPVAVCRRPVLRLWGAEHLPRALCCRRSLTRADTAVRARRARHDRPGR